MNRGLHIVLEGPDASGKKTQSELLVKRLTEVGNEAMRISFPDYEAPYGRLVRQYLDHKSPSADPAYASILYAADRREKAPEITHALEGGIWVVCDRYVESNLAHQVARAEGKEAQQELAAWILDTEYDILGIPRADLTILLNVAYEICHQKAAERADWNVDRHEQDGEHLRLAWEQYQQLAKDGNWPVVNCSPAGILLSREEIHEQIWQVVQTHHGAL